MAIFSNLYEAGFNGVITEDVSLIAGEELDHAINEATTEVYESMYLCLQDYIMLNEALMIADITIDEQAIQYVKEEVEEGKDAEEAKEEAKETANEKSTEVKKSFGSRVKAIADKVIKTIENLFKAFVDAIRAFFKTNVLKAHPGLKMAGYQFREGIKVKADFKDLTQLREKAKQFAYDAVNGAKKDASDKVIEEYKKLCKIDSDKEVAVDRAFIDKAISILESSDALIDHAKKLKDTCIKAVKNAKEAETTGSQVSKIFSLYISAIKDSAKLANAALWKIVRDKGEDKKEETKKEDNKEENKNEEPAAESMHYTDLFESFLGGNY